MSMWEQAERELADESEGQGVQAESVLGFRLPIGFSRAQFRDFCVLMLVLTLLVSGYFMTAPLLVFAQAQFFNNNQPCIGRMQTVDCTAAMADVSSIQATTQLVQSIAAFVLSPVLGRVSDSIGRRWILIGSCAPMWLTNIALWAWAATRGKVSLYPYYVGQCFPFFLSFLAPVYIADIVPASHRAVFFAFQIGIFGVTQIWASHVAGFFTPPNDAPQNTTIGQVADEFHSDMFNVVSLSVIMSSVAMALVVLVLPETLPVDQRKPFDLRNRSELAQAFNTLSQLKVLKRNNVFLRLAATLFFSSMCQSGNYGFLQLYLTRELNFMPDNTVILSEATGTYSLLSSFVIAPLVISAFGEKLTIVFSLSAFVVYALLFATGIVRTPFLVYVVSSLFSISTMNVPAITAIKSTLSAGNEQGQVIGAISAVQAIAQGLGPALFNTLYHVSLEPDNPFDPLFVWWIIVAIEIVAVGSAAMVPDHRPALKQMDVHMELQESLLDSKDNEAENTLGSKSGGGDLSSGSILDQVEADLSPASDRSFMTRVYMWVASQ